MEPDPRIPVKQEGKGSFTPLSMWLGNPSEKPGKHAQPADSAPCRKNDQAVKDEDCRSTIEVERNGPTITRIHITCSCGDRHSIELHELPEANAEDSSLPIQPGQQ